jgi:hypothetical protein
MFFSLLPGAEKEALDPIGLIQLLPEWVEEEGVVMMLRKRGILWRNFVMRRRRRRKDTEKRCTRSGD